MFKTIEPAEYRDDFMRWEAEMIVDSEVEAESKDMRHAMDAIESSALGSLALHEVPPPRHPEA